jgi:hypothetical protein
MGPVDWRRRRGVDGSCRASPRRRSLIGEETGNIAHELHRLIEAATLAGGDLDEIEERLITPAPLDEDDRAALWLYAEAPLARRREPAHEPSLPVG